MTPQKIKMFRLSRGETQAEFARSVGTTVTTVSRWETGKSAPLPIYIEVMWRLEKTT